MLANIQVLCESADPALAAKAGGWMETLAGGGAQE
jgi:hypothetical protein